MDARRIEWASLSRYRGVLMGIAIIMIVLFHVALPRSSAFFGLKRMGNMGVDIFFFLSGIGLWFAWTKRPDVLHFYHAACCAYCRHGCWHRRRSICPTISDRGGSRRHWPT